MRTFVLALLPIALVAQTKTIEDNPRVRILSALDKPHTPTALHKHDFNRVMIYLDPIRIVLRYEDGEVDRQNWRKGQVAWSPGRRLHTGENLMQRSARVVEVELKKPPSGKPFRISARDPVTANPKNVRVEFENESVRVLRCKYAANVREPLHEHLSGERLTLALDDVELRVTTEGSPDRITKLAAGQPVWSTGAVVHAAQANRAVELIVIELK